jgi:hypothetical protein
MTNATPAVRPTEFNPANGVPPLPSVASMVSCVKESLAACKPEEEPYRHWFMENFLDRATTRNILALPVSVPDWAETGGRREYHNGARTYFAGDMLNEYPVCAAFAETFSRPDVVKALADTYGAPLDGTYLRLELAADSGGFWLEPHTDLGVKAVTILLYLSEDEAHTDLATDIYYNAEKWYGRGQFGPGKALVFVPSDNTWHGFEKRTITGVRKSLIINYVTSEWRAKEQLVDANKPVTTALTA